MIGRFAFRRLIFNNDSSLWLIKRLIGVFSRKEVEKSSSVYFFDFYIMAELWLSSVAVLTPNETHTSNSYGRMYVVDLSNSSNRWSSYDKKIYLIFKVGELSRVSFAGWSSLFSLVNNETIDMIKKVLIEKSNERWSQALFFSPIVIEKN